MDFWARFIGATAPSPSTNQTRPSNPQQRLGQFKKIYKILLQQWHNGDTIPRDSTSTEDVRLSLHRLAELLNDDLRSPLPHLCVAFAATSRVLILACRLASALQHVGVIYEALSLCRLVIESEEEDYLEDRGFAAALMLFIDNIACSRPLTVDVDTEGIVVEVLFGIASRIRLQPQILPVWFRPAVDDFTPSTKYTLNINSFRKAEFPLFYYLLDYVHYEGRAGEFARMGLLYIIESATRSEDLERWIIESDLATLMASGLGALYSQLSRKLVSTFTKEEIPLILTLSDLRARQPPPDTEETSSPDFQSHLTTFLAYLVFWQDVLEHCTSVEIKRTLLDHFQFLFLQQLLYPSLLESSDVDGGSSVAVLTYLRCIFESIDHPDLITLILQYLLALQEQPSEPPSPARPTTLARRRKSQVLITHLRSGEEKPSPALFNLVDLILSGLPSRNQQTVTATLRLLSVMLLKQHLYAKSTLLKSRPTKALDESRTVGAHNKEVDRLLSLAEDIGEDDGLEESYEAYLHDNRSNLESHPCSVKLFAFTNVAELLGNVEASLPVERPMQSVEVHTVVAEDPLLKNLLVLLHLFFANDVETNLALTQALVDLASCGLIRLEGWLLVHPAQYTFPSSREAAVGDEMSDVSGPPSNQSNPNASTSIEEYRLRALKLARQEPTWDPDCTAPIPAALDSLVRQVNNYRQDVQDFDTYLAEHKLRLKAPLHDEEVSADSSGLPRPQSSSNGTSPSRAGKDRQLGSISERLQPKSNLAVESRSSSPRGRQGNISAPAIVGRFSHLHISPSRSSSLSTSRTYSPSPLRTGSPTIIPKIEELRGPVSTGLQRKIRVSSSSASDDIQRRTLSSSESSSVHSESAGQAGAAEETREVTLSHLLTNVVMLQEFILELAALIEIRASLFGEVRFL